MAKNIHLILDSAELKTVGRKARTPYRPNKLFDNRITPEARAITKKIFETVQNELGGLVFDVNIYTRNILKVAAPILGEVQFDVDAGTKHMIKAVNDSGMRYGMDKFLNSVFK